MCDYCGGWYYLDLVGNIMVCRSCGRSPITRPATPDDAEAVRLSKMAERQLRLLARVD